MKIAVNIAGAVSVLAISMTCFFGFVNAVIG